MWDEGATMLEIQVNKRGVELTPDEEDLIRKRVSFALDRFAPKISVIAVRLTDLNGPRGGTDKQCQITAELREGGHVRASDCDSNTAGAVRRACRRIRAVIWRMVGVRTGR